MTKRILFVAAAALAFGAGFASTRADAAPTDTSNVIRVDVRDLDMTTVRGKEIAQRRIERAARTHCAAEGRTLADRTAERACRAAFNNALPM